MSRFSENVEVIAATAGPTPPADFGTDKGIDTGQPQGGESMPVVPNDRLVARSQPIHDQREQVEQLVNALFLPGDVIQVALHHSCGGHQVQWYNPAKLLEDLNELDVENRSRGMNVWFGVNPRPSHGDSEAADIKLTRSLFVDLDLERNGVVEPGGVTLEFVERIVADAGLPQPSIVVNSGHGAHVYFLLTGTVPLAEWDEAMANVVHVLGGDACVNRDRQLRLPGFYNLKEDKPVVPAVLLSCDPQRKYCLDELTTTRTGPTKAAALPREAETPMTGSIGDPSVVAAQAWFENLGQESQSFLMYGAPEGKRNNLLFSTACDMCACGVPINETRKYLGDVGRRTGLSADEIEKTIVSAYSRRRTRARRGVAKLPMLSNVKKSKGSLVARRIEEIADDVRQGCGDRLRSYAGALVYVYDEGHVDRRVRHMGSDQAFRSWLQEQFKLNWRSPGRKTRGPGLVTVATLYQHLLHHSPRCPGIELYPHVPPIPDVLYVRPELTSPARDDVAPTPRLDALVGALNADTDLDRDLLKALIVTPMWGGEPGARPAFCLTSMHGKGTGKTLTATLVGELYGGSISRKKDERTDQLLKRLLSPDAVGRRVLLMDNLRGDLSNEDIESLITARRIDGHRLFIGQAERLNLFTFVLTSNGMSLTPDMADRTVLVRLGAPNRKFDFQGWWSSYLSKYHDALLAEIAAFLASPEVSHINPEDRSRWTAWERGVLCRLPNGAQIAAELRRRRLAIDADAAAAVAIEQSLDDHALDFRVRNDGLIRIELNQMEGVVHATEYLNGLMGGRLTMKLKALQKSGFLQRLNHTRDAGGFFWTYAPNTRFPRREDAPPTAGSVMAA